MKWLYRPFLCKFSWHDWDYFVMTRLDGGLEHYRCCLRCEKSEHLSTSWSVTR